jgi:hypothetical protein
MVSATGSAESVNGPLGWTDFFVRLPFVKKRGLLWLPCGEMGPKLALTGGVAILLWIAWFAAAAVAEICCPRRKNNLKIYVAIL